MHHEIGVTGECGRSRLVACVMWNKSQTFGINMITPSKSLRNYTGISSSSSSSFMAQQPPVGQGLLIIEASLSHSDTPHSVGHLWTSDRSDAKTSTRQHTTLTTDRHPCPQRDSNPQSQQASGRRLAP